MTAFWIPAGIMLAASFLVLLIPWLRTIPRFGSVPALPWQAGAAALAMIFTVLGALTWWSELQAHPATSVALSTAKTTDSVESDARTWADISNGLAAQSGAVSVGSAAASSARPMDAAIASLQGRLTRGGGTTADWELLAQSYEFVGRPEDAVKARAHTLP